MSEQENGILSQEWIVSQRIIRNLKMQPTLDVANIKKRNNKRNNNYWGYNQ